MKSPVDYQSKYSTAALWLVILINSLWIVRYGMRLSMPAMVIGEVAYIAVSLALVKLYRSHRLLGSNGFFVAVGVIFLAVATFIGLKVDITTVNVDRWEIIETFWRGVREGIQPYTAKASNGNLPGPLPFYFVVCYPFYALKAYWLIPVAAVAIVWVLARRSTFGVSRLFFYLLVASPSLYWEIMTGSTLYFNTTLFFLWFIWLLHSNIKDNKILIASAILGGLLMATRQVFFIPVFIYFLYSMTTLRASFGRMFCWGAVMVAVWVCCFLPIIAVYGLDSFLEYNPFIVQDIAIFSFKYVIYFVAAALITGLAARKKMTVVFMSGLIMGCFEFSAITWYMYLTGGRLLALDPIPTDISYTIFAIPFLLYLIKTGKNDK